MLTEQDVQRAVEFESHDAPVLSVYLNVDPRRRTGESHKASLLPKTSSSSRTISRWAITAKG
jgi:hypothetical protein